MPTSTLCGNLLEDSHWASDESKSYAFLPSLSLSLSPPLTESNAPHWLHAKLDRHKAASCLAAVHFDRKLARGSGRIEGVRVEHRHQLKGLRGFCQAGQRKEASDNRKRCDATQRNAMRAQLSALRFNAAYRLRRPSSSTASPARCSGRVRRARGARASPLLHLSASRRTARRRSR